MWILLLWKRYDYRDLFILNGQDGKPMVFISESAALEHGQLAMGIDYKAKAVRID